MPLFDDYRDSAYFMRSLFRIWCSLISASVIVLFHGLLFGTFECSDFGKISLGQSLAVVSCRITSIVMVRIIIKMINC